MAIKVLGSATNTRTTTYTITSLEATCDRCGVQHHYEAEYGHSVPRGWTNVYTKTNGTQMLCQECLGMRNEIHKSPFFYRLRDSLHDILNSFENYDDDETGNTYYSQPDEFEDMVALMEEIREVANDFYSDEEDEDDEPTEVPENPTYSMVA